jgi:hypothetical protein
VPQPLFRPLSSPRCLLYFGKHPIALATGFQVREAITQFPVEVLGDVYVKSHETVAIRVSGSFDTMHVLSRPLSGLTDDAGPLWPRGETLEVIQYEPLTVTLVDALTGKYVLRLNSMMPESRTWTVAAGSVLMENGSFVAISVSEHKDAIIPVTS